MLKINKKLQTIVFLIIIVCNFIINFRKIYKHKIEYDEIYVLARANSETINAQVKDFSLDLGKINPVRSIYRKLNHHNTENFFHNLKRHLLNFYNISNHPPVNDLLAKIFIYKQSDFVYLRYYAFATFVLLIMSLFFFLHYNSFKINENLAIIALYSSMSLVSYQSIFPKSYSLLITFLLMVTMLWQEYLKSKSKFTLIGFFLLCNLSFFTHFLSIIFIPLLVLTISGSQSTTLRQSFKYLWSLKNEFLFLFLNMIPVRLLMNYQSEGTLMHFEQEDKLILVRNFFRTLTTILTFNLESVISKWVLLFVLILLCLNFKGMLLNIFFRLFIIIPSTLLILDLILKSNLSGHIRFFLVVLPFFSILLYQYLFLKRKEYLYLCVVLICLGSNLSYGLQSFKTINFTTDPIIHKATNIETIDLDKKTLILINGFNAMEVSYIHHLITNALKIHPLHSVPEEEFYKIENIDFLKRKNYENMLSGNSEELKKYQRIIQ
jgi:hypothetical protein